MTRVAVLSANLGSYDVTMPWTPQRAPAGVTIDVHRFTDANFPPRRLAMTSRLQAGLLKMFGHEFVPGYDLYLWVDASCSLLNPDAVAWFLARIGTADLLLFRHPDRGSVREEYEFMKARMARPGETYLNSRYAGEWLDEQYAALVAAGHAEIGLFASTAFLYRNVPTVRAMLKDWWFWKSRYLLHDQLALPYVVAQSGASMRVLEENYLRCPALTFTRKRQ